MLTPKLETKRLLLREIPLEDVEAIYNYRMKDIGTSLMI